MNSKKGNSVRSRFRDNQTLIFALGIAVILLYKVSYFLFTKDNPYFSYLAGDEFFYHKWAVNISHGEIINSKVFFAAPFYAYFLGLIYAVVTPSLAVIRISNIVLSLFSVGLLYFSGKRIFNNKFALLVPLLYGFCGLFTFYESFGEKTMLVFFLYSLSFFLFVIADQKGMLKNWAVSGVASGMLMMAHGASITLAFCISVYLLYKIFFLKKVRIGTFFTYVFFFFVGLSPATIHNKIVSGDLMLAVSNGGQNFYTANFQKNKYGLYQPPSFAEAGIDSEYIDFRLEAQRRLGRKIDPSEVSSFWLKQGIQEVLSDIPHSVERFFIRLRLMFNNTEVTDTRSYTFFKEQSAFLRAPFFDFGIFVVLGGLGFLCTLRERKFHIFHAFTLVYSLFFSFFFVFGRYRLPLTIPLIFFSIAFFEKVYIFIKENSPIKESPIRIYAATCCAALFFIWFTYSDVIPGFTDNPSVPHSQLADIYSGSKNIRMNSPELEINEYKHCVDRFLEIKKQQREIYVYPANKSDSDFHDCLGNVAVLSFMSRRDNELVGAIEYLDKSKEYFGNNTLLWSLLGKAYDNKGAYSEAKKSYLSLLKINPNDIDANYYLGKIHFKNGNKVEALQYLNRIVKQNIDSYFKRDAISMINNLQKMKP